jgi:hypothetical protein
MATGTPTLCDGLSIFGISREGRCTEGNTECAAADEPPRLATLRDKFGRLGV